nr:CopD family protein [Microbacterium sp. NIBRBAC000506063]
MFSVVLLAVSGTIMAILILDSWDALVSTGYGRTLLLKLGIVVAVVALAAWNRTRLLPAITRRPPATLQWATLRRILGYEAALLVTVIAVTGFLSNSSPATSITTPGCCAAGYCPGDARARRVPGADGERDTEPHRTRRQHSHLPPGV